MENNTKFIDVNSNSIDDETLFLGLHVENMIKKEKKFTKISAIDNEQKLFWLPVLNIDKEILKFVDEFINNSML